jgi:hypothetical protein
VNGIAKAAPQIHFALHQSGISEHSNRIANEFQLPDGRLARNNRLDDFALILFLTSQVGVPNPS